MDIPGRFPRLVIKTDGICEVHGNLTDIIYRVRRLVERVVGTGQRFDREQDSG